MKIQPLLTIVLLCLVGSAGCRLAQNAWLTTVSEPIHYPRNLDEKFSKKRFAAMAEVALEEARACARAERDDYYCDPYTIDHERGFVDGFVDYLVAGGTGDPPPLPPRRYWRGKYQTPFGQQCVHDWFEGYKHGAVVARASNYRSFMMVPVSDAVTANAMQSIYGRISASDEDEDDEASTVSGDDVYAESDSPLEPERPVTTPSVSRLQRIPKIEHE